MRQVLPEKQPLAISGQAAEILIASGNGDGALLYLYILQQGGLFQADTAARALHWPEARVESAFASLTRLALIGEGSTVPQRILVEPADEPPRYDLEDVRRRSSAGGDFAPLVTEVQRLLGRVLSGPELLTLFGIYDHLAMPPEVILLLVSHCSEELHRRYGEGRKLSMRSIEKTAYQWARSGVHSLEDAEKYLQFRAARQAEASRVKSALGIHDRRLAPSEQRFIAAWLDKGYTADTLELAYDRTVLNTGALNWKYMDSIVNSWYAKGLFTPAEIQARDSGPKPGSKGAGPEADDLALLRKQLGMK